MFGWCVWVTILHFSIFLLLSCHVAFNVKGWQQSFLSNQQFCRKKSYHHELNKQVAFQAGSMLIRWANVWLMSLSHNFVLFNFPSFVVSCSFRCERMVTYFFLFQSHSFDGRIVNKLNQANKLPFKLKAY
jgi:hypothetical protein